MPDPAPHPDAYPRLRRYIEPRWQQRRILRQMPGGPFWVLLAIAVALFAVVALPYLLPLDDPDIVPPERLADPNGAFVEVDGETLYYVHEAGEGAPVVLLHGFGGSTVTWRETIPALAAAGYDVYALDLRGFGLSEKGLGADYSHAAQAARVIAWMDALSIERAAVVGHSMGGSVAAYLALRNPARVERLALIDAAILTDAGFRVPDTAFDVPFARRWAQVVMRRVLPEMVGDFLREAAYDDSAVTAELVEDYARALRTPGWDLALLGLVRDADRNALPAPVSALDVPTLILWGAKDGVVPPADGEQLARQIVGAAHVELAGVGHLPMHEQSEAFNDALLAFLGG